MLIRGVGGGGSGRVCVLIRWVRSGRRGGSRARGTWFGGGINSTKSLVIIRAVRVLNLNWGRKPGGHLFWQVYVENLKD